MCIYKIKFINFELKFLSKWAIVIQTKKAYLSQLFFAPTDFEIKSVVLISFLI